MLLDAPNRPDMDIEEEIIKSLRSFGPLKAARAFFKIQSIKGHVKVTGNVGSFQAKHVLLSSLQKIPGINTVDTSDLYDDENLRMNISSVIREGILINVQFGSVELDTQLPNNDREGNQATMRMVQSMMGVRQVVMRFRGLRVEA